VTQNGLIKWWFLAYKMRSSRATRSSLPSQTVNQLSFFFYLFFYKNHRHGGTPGEEIDVHVRLGMRIVSPLAWTQCRVPSSSMPSPIVAVRSEKARATASYSFVPTVTLHRQGTKGYA
jgi:hypothetical protein